MNLYTLKKKLMNSTGVDFFTKITPDFHLNLSSFNPQTNKKLWNANFDSFKKILAFAKANDLWENADSFAADLQFFFGNDDFSFDFENGRSLLAGAIHYYLLGFAECVEYSTTSKKWLIGGPEHTADEWIRAANYILSEAEIRLGVDSDVYFFEK